MTCIKLVVKVMQTLLLLTAALWAAYDLALKQVTAATLSSVLLLRFGSAAICATALLPALHNGRIPSAVETLLLSSSLVAAFAGVATAAVFGPPLATVPIFFLWPSFAVLFNAAFKGNALQMSDAYLIACNVGAALSVALPALHLERTSMALKMCGVALAAAVIEGARLAYVKTSRIERLDPNTKILTENAPAALVILAAHALQHRTAWLQLSWAWYVLLPLVGYVGSYALYTGLRATQMQQVIGYLAVEVVAVMLAYLALRWFPSSTRSELRSLLLFAAVVLVAFV
jgi:hypothetical protein